MRWILFIIRWEELHTDLRAKEQDFFQSMRFLELLRTLELDYPPSYYPALQEQLKDCLKSPQFSSKDEMIIKLYMWKVIDLPHKQGADILGKKMNGLQVEQGRVFKRYKSCLQDLSKYPTLYLYKITKGVPPSQMEGVLEKSFMSYLPRYYQNQEFLPLLKELNRFSPSLSPEIQWQNMKSCLANLERSERLLVLSYIWQVQKIPQVAMVRLLKIPESQILNALAVARQNFQNCLEVLALRSALPSSSQQEDPVLALYQSVIENLDALSLSRFKKHLSNLSKYGKKVFSNSKVRALSKRRAIEFAERYDIWEQLVFFTQVLKLEDISMTDLGRLKKLSFEQLLEISYTRDRQRLELLEYLDGIISSPP